jgi:hypothetical protein
MQLSHYRLRNGRNSLTNYFNNQFNCINSALKFNSTVKTKTTENNPY